MARLAGSPILFFALAASALVRCGSEPYIELQVADDRLPFLRPQIDFDALGVEARATDCANAVVEYPPQNLPATLTIVRGDCFKDRLTLQAFALRERRRIAESMWLPLTFPRSGVSVATATLAELPGPRIRFRTGFEVGDPFAGSAETLFVVRQKDVANLVARVDTLVAEEGSRSILISGTATSAESQAIVRAVATDLVIDPGDRLEYEIRVDAGSAAPTVGIDLQLDSGANAKGLGLEDVTGLPVYPASPQGRLVGSWQRFIVDLTPAHGARLVGVLFGFDAREVGRPGTFTARLDDLEIQGP